MPVDIKKEYGTTLRNLADTMLGVARESVTLIKRSDQTVATKLTHEQEWQVYLEFLKVMFNLADRISAFYIPIQQQPYFMDSLEDHVSSQLTTLLAPSMSSSEIDDQAIILSIGEAVAESRKIYEKHKFVVAEDTKERNNYFRHAAERIAARAGATNNQAILSTSTLCISAVIPAMTALFEGKTPEEPASSDTSTSPDTNKSSETTQKPSPSEPSASGPQAIKLISVVCSMNGEECETRWGVFPQFRRDLRPEQIKELTNHMNRVAQLLGDKFAILSSKLSEESPRPSGHA